MPVDFKTLISPRWISNEARCMTFGHQSDALAVKSYFDAFNDDSCGSTVGVRDILVMF